MVPAIVNGADGNRQIAEAATDRIGDIVVGAVAEMVGQIACDSHSQTRSRPARQADSLRSHSGL